MLETKKDSIKEFIQIYLNNFIEEADNSGNLDFFKIEINNHNGTLQIDHKFRSREKVY